jgi:hypothetical protein
LWFEVFFLFWIKAYGGEVLKKFAKGLLTTTNFLEVLVNDEEAILV